MYQHVPQELTGPSKNYPDQRTASQFVESIDLTQRGGRNCICRLTGQYSLDELEIYFSSLRKMFNEEGFPHPISINLIALTCKDDAHAITLGYDLQNKRWILIDPNKMMYVGDDSQLAQIIFKQIFQATHCITMHTNLYVAKFNPKQDADNAAKGNVTIMSNVSKINDYLNRWKSTKEWNVHAVTLEKSQRLDDHGMSLANLALGEEILRPLKNVLDGNNILYYAIIQFFNWVKI